MKYNFDKLANRRNTNACKWEVKENELPMWIADMDFETCPDVKEAIIKRANIGAFGYSEIPEDYFKAYQYWWKKRFNFEIQRDWMIYASGVVASISSIVRYMTNIGDNVIVLPPVYNIFYNSIINNKRNVLPCDLVEKCGEYSINFEDLEDKMKNEKTSLLIFCNPHNPVGKIWSKEELIRIGELAKKYNVLVLSDEVHCDFTTPGKTYTPYTSVNDVNKYNSITCLSPSKTFNVAGLQAALDVIPNEDIRKRVNRGLNNDEVAEPNFFSMDAIIAAYNKGEEWVDELKEYIYKNKVYFVNFIKENLPHLKVELKDALYLVWVDVSYYKKAKEFASELREKTGLYVSSGNVYGGNGDNFIRVNLATNLDNVKDACNRLNKYVKELTK